MAKSNAIKWERHPDLKIPIKQSDEIIKRKTNNISIIPLNRRHYEQFNATVILGHHEVIDDEILVKEGVRVWSCKIDQRGAVSSIGLQDVDVTVIIHGSKNEAVVNDR